jgi:ABC-type transport system involved in cytochrome bd biosynthesis fused ATPase/permease subunit
VSDFDRLRTWLRRAAPQSFDLVKALFMASVASLAATGLFIGALSLLVVSSQRPGLWAIAVFLIALELVAFLRSPLRFAERMSTHRLGFAAVAQWRHWLMSVVGHWDYSRWQRYGAGDLLERSLTDTDELQDLWLRGVIPSVATVVTMVLSDVGVAVLAPLGQWWGVAVGTLVLQCVVASLLLSRLGPQIRADRQLRACRGAYVASLVSSRAAAPEIERLGAADFLRHRDDVLVAELSRSEHASARERRRDALVVVIGPLACLGLLALLHPRSAAVWTVVAALVALNTFETLATIRTAVHVAVAVTGGAERLDDLEVSARSARAVWPSDITLVFRDVAVTASKGGTRRISGVVGARRRVALSGSSGSGKSTLLRALARLDDVESSEISIGGREIDDIAEAEIRSHVTLVPSEPGLLHGYVRDVVGVGVAVRDEDLASLGALGLPVERNDVWEELSRGERQRVALVRALARRPDILMLDEPTSALGDVETAAVLKLLSTFASTVIIASHDPRVLAWCDDVIELSDAITA